MWQPALWRGCAAGRRTAQVGGGTADGGAAGAHRIDDDGGQVDVHDLACVSVAHPVQRQRRAAAPDVQHRGGERHVQPQKWAKARV